MSASIVTLDDCIDYMDDIVNKEDNDYKNMMNDDDYEIVMEEEHCN